MTRILTGLGLILLLYGCADCTSSTCTDYRYQEEAQRAFNNDPDCQKVLDGDQDRIACEHLPSEKDSLAGAPGGAQTGAGCPQTANCGCSNKPKAECPSQCCKWVVGDGCKCK